MIIQSFQIVILPPAQPLPGPVTAAQLPPASVDLKRSSSARQYTSPVAESLTKSTGRSVIVVPEYFTAESLTLAIPGTEEISRFLMSKNPVNGEFATPLWKLSTVSIPFEYAMNTPSYSLIIASIVRIYHVDNNGCF